MGVCLVEDWGFRPGGVHSHLLPHNLYSNAVHIVGTPGRWVPLGNSLAFIKLHKTRFLGPFGIPTQTFTFLKSPITISFSSKTKHQAKLSVTGQYYCRDQTVTERPVRPRVSAPTIMYIRTYVYLCHTPVTLIKSTYLLTTYYYCSYHYRHYQYYGGAKLHFTGTERNNIINHWQNNQI